MSLIVGWQDAEFHWEVAGIKLLGASGTLVKNNYIFAHTGWLRNLAGFC